MVLEYLPSERHFAIVYDTYYYIPYKSICTIRVVEIKTLGSGKGKISTNISYAFVIQYSYTFEIKQKKNK